MPVKVNNICIIPARGGSKGIKRKNTRIICGRSLVEWSIKHAKEASSVDLVVVSTDDSEIKELAINSGAIVHDRSKKNAADDVHSVHAVLECIDYLSELYEPKYVTMILPTSPLRTKDDIDNTFLRLKDGNFDSALSVTKLGKTKSSIRIAKDNELVPLINCNTFENQRQDEQEVLIVNGSIYISTCDFLKKNKSFHSGRVAFFEMPYIRSIDINEEEDFIIAEIISENFYK